MSNQTFYTCRINGAISHLSSHIDIQLRKLSPERRKQYQQENQEKAFASAEIKKPSNQFCSDVLASIWRP